LEENPFLKDYRDDMIQAILDMNKVRNEVSKFLAERYGYEFNHGNMVIFLAVFTAEYLLYMDVGYERFAFILRIVYDFIKECIDMKLAEFKGTP
jgi:hypothetical protein